MTAIGLVVSAVLLGLAVTLLTGDDRVVSLEVWLAATLSWMLLLTGREVHRRVPAAPAPVSPMFTRRADEAPDDAPVRPSSLRAAEHLIAQAIADPRIYRTRLQPRLRDLSASRDDREVPDDLRWMLAPAIDRAPSPEEIERFLAATVAPGFDQETRP